MAQQTQVKPCLDHPSFVAHWGPSPTTERGNNFHIGCHPKEPVIIYPSGKFFIVRNLQDPSKTFVYRGHNNKTTVAKWSPNGYWVASADSSGKVRVWSWDNPEHMLKIEIHGIAGAIKDLAWDAESKCIVCVGEGGINMRAFKWDSGSNLGEVVGHNKRVVSCDYRPAKPAKIISASEDMRTIVFKGPPFSLDHSNKDQHSNFINCVRFSPDATKIATCGSDRKIWLYDGETGEPTSELPMEHTGGVYSLAWSKDGTQLVSASADKTCKLWDVASASCQHTWAFSEEQGVGDMQVAVAWCGEHIISVSLDGSINLLQPGSDRPVKVIHAHQVAITAMCPYPTPDGRLLTGSFDGVVCGWELATGLATRLVGQVSGSVSGQSHTNMVTGLAVCSAGVVSVGWDDTLRLASDGRTYSQSASTAGQPSAVAARPSSDLVAVAAADGVMLLRGVNVATTLKTPYTPLSVALLGEEEVAVGGSDNKIYIYSIKSDTLEQARVIEGHRGQVTCLEYSPDGALLAAGDSMREVNVWIRGTWEAQVKSLWQFHTTKINCLAWAPNGREVASGGQDENIYIWSLDKPRKRIQYPFAHKDGVTGLAWLSDDELMSSGSDHCVAKWNITKDRIAFK